MAKFRSSSGQAFLPLAERLSSCVAELKRFEAELSIGSQRDKEFFVYVIGRAFNLLDLYPTDLRQALKVSPSTIYRWMNGQAAPSPVARRLVFGWISQQIIIRRRDLERRLKEVSDGNGKEKVRSAEDNEDDLVCAQNLPDGCEQTECEDMNSSAIG